MFSFLLLFSFGFDDLLSSLTDFVNNPSDTEKLYEFILAYYRAGAYASNTVLKGCYEILSSLEKSTVSNEPYRITEGMINDVYNAIRKDINPRESPFNFGAFHIAYTKKPKNE